MNLIISFAVSIFFFNFKAPFLISPLYYDNFVKSNLERFDIFLIDLGLT